MATGVFFGLYFLAVEAARRTTGAARVTFEASVVTAAALLAVALAQSSRGCARRASPAASALLGMAWVSHAGGQGLLTVALGRLPATFSSLVIFLEAIAAALFAFVLLGEPISLRPGPRRPADHGRHLHRPPAPSLSPFQAAPGRVLRG